MFPLFCPQPAYSSSFSWFYIREYKWQVVITSGGSVYGGGLVSAWEVRFNCWLQTVGLCLLKWLEKAHSNERAVCRLMASKNGTVSNLAINTQTTVPSIPEILPKFWSSFFNCLIEVKWFEVLNSILFFKAFHTTCCTYILHYVAVGFSWHWDQLRSPLSVLIWSVKEKRVISI